MRAMVEQATVAKRWPVVAIAAIALGAGLIAPRVSPPLLIAAGVASAFAILLAAFGLRGFVLGALLVRPLLDTLSSTTLLVAGTFSNIPEDTLNPAGVLGLVVVALWIGLLFNDSRVVLRSRLPASLILYTTLLMWAMATFVLAEDRAVAAAQWARLAAIASFAWLVVVTRIPPQHLLRAIAVSVIVPASVALLQAVNGTGDVTSTTGVNRVYGTLVHPNPFGGFVTLSMIATFVLMTVDGIRLRRLWGVLLAIELLVLVLTFSRGAWLQALAAFGVLLVLVMRPRIAMWTLSAAVGAAIVAATNWGTIAERFASLGSDNAAINTGLGRTLVWQEHAQLMVDRGAYLGSGVGSVNVLADRYLAIAAGTHNDYLRVLVELGLPGFAMFVGIFGVGLWQSLGIARRSKRGSVERLLASAAVAALVAYACGAVFEGLLSTTAYQWYWWTLITIPLGGQARVRQDAHQ